MAKKKDTKTMNDDRLLDSDEKDLLTLKGYSKAFESCEKNSDIFARLTKEWDDIDVGVWKNHLSSKKMLQPAEYLFSFWENNFENKQLEEKDCRKFIEIFSLLENVFRNVLLQPYIPSYRIINMNCGPYHSFVTISDKLLLFEKLNFHEKSSNLLIYNGNSSIRTIIYAITCSIFWHNLMMKLKNK